MRKILIACCVFSAAAWAQTADTLVYRAMLSPANETPAITDYNARGVATVLLHVVRDANGRALSGTVDFIINDSFPEDVTVTGLHIHKGAEGVAGPVVLNTGISGTNPVAQAATAGSIQLPAQALATNATGVDALNGILADPSQFYVNLHTTKYPNGIIRGQLLRAQVTTLLASMSPLNETPPITDYQASAQAAVVVVATRDTQGSLTSAQVFFDAAYTMPEAVTFTGFHIHRGGPGVAGPVVINTGLRSEASTANGVGTLSYPVEVAVQNLASAAAVDGLFNDPWNYYINLHTSQYPNGIVRNQLTTADHISIPVTLLPSNEIPAVNVQGNVVGRFSADVLRGPDGEVRLGLATWDLNFRLPAATTITGLHVHTGGAGANGSVVIPSGISGQSPVQVANGFGNYFAQSVVLTTGAVAALNGLLKNPEAYYVNVHSSEFPNGLARAQVAAVTNALPSLVALMNAVSDARITTMAPCGLMTLFGAGLTKASFTGNGVLSEQLLTRVNGSQVTVGGVAAPIVMMGVDPLNFAPTFVVVQVPCTTQPGAAALTLTNSNGSANAGSVTIAASAPGVYVDQMGVIGFRPDLSFLRPGNPAQRTDRIVVYATGLGQTNPAMTTGSLLPADQTYRVVVMPTASIGTVPVTVTNAVALPGMPGIYAVAIQLTNAVPTGNQALVLAVGNARSNAAPIVIQ
ncbi:MAG: CHRD domain-containing protein [Acidobacteria bacterium]|nr:CHRD domain-containing protein [Acidobacteriota bacterium]